MAFNMGMSMSNALLAIYSAHLGASVALVGFIVSSFAISSILFRLISAPVMDTYNRKYLVILAALMLSIAFGGFSISTSIPMVFCFRILQGCAMAFGNACCLTMVADMLPKEKYNSGIGYYSLAQVICSAVAPSVGLELVQFAGFRTTYTIAACIMLFSAFLVSRIKLNFTRTRKLKLSFGNIIAREAMLPAGFHFLMIVSGTCVSAFLFLFAQEQEITGNIGLFFTVTAITMLVTRPVIGRLTDKYGLVKVAVPAVACNVLSFFIISWSTSLFGLLGAAFIAAFGQGAIGPAIQALTMKSVTPQRRGAASSTNYIAMDIGALTGPAIAGQIISLFGYVAMWRILVIPYIAGAMLLVVFKKKVQSIEEEFASGH